MDASSDPAWAPQLQQIVDAADQPEGGVQVIRVPGEPATGLRSAIREGLACRGYALVELDRGDVMDPPDALCHRHVALLCGNDRSRLAAVKWVRSLAQATPRRHLVVCFAGPADGEDATAAVTPGSGLALRKGVSLAAGVSARRWARAERWQRCGRPRAAHAWMTAAIAASARHGDRAGAVGLAIEAGTALCHDGEWDAARGRVRGVLGQRDLAWAPYSEASALFADTALARGELGLARDWLMSVLAEAELLGQPVPLSVRSRCAELAFWLGKGLRGPADVEPKPGSASEAGWLAMVAWSRGRLATVTALASQLRTWWHDRDPHAALWTPLLSVLLSGRDRRHPESELHALSRIADESRIPVRLRALARAMGARAWLLRGRVDCVSRGRLLSAGGDPCERLFDAMLDKHVRGGLGRPSGSAERRWLGFQSLLNERADMYLVDGVTGLLHVMEDAEDELSALAGGCQWVRKQAGASAVGIVSADHTRLVATQGWKPIDLSTEIAQILSGPARDVRAANADDEAGSFGVPIRYGGVTLGHVVARGAAADRPVVQEAAQALAAVSGSALCARLDALALQAQARDCAPEILGRGPLIMDVRQAIARAAGTSFPVLIEGESGTGKELVARALHRLSPRRDHRFQAVNCAALTDELVEAELFGHARGAFTGAVGPRAGLFEEAHGGTLFLDEISELSPRAQAKLLRVLQEREVRRVGENSARRVDVRPIAATNLPLADAVARGRFRDDLRFRLAVVRIRLPPLRDRLDDLPLLAHVFWRRALAETGKRAVLGPDTLARLARHHWPGNVRELQNVIAGLAVAAPARGRVTARHVSQVLAHGVAGEEGALTCPLHLDTARRLFEQRLVAAALARHAGRRTAAARDLGLTRQGLTKAIRRLGLSAPVDVDDPEERTAGVA